MEGSLFSSHFVILGLLLSIKGMPLDRKTIIENDYYFVLKVKCNFLNRAHCPKCIAPENIHTPHTVFFFWFVTHPPPPSTPFLIPLGTPGLILAFLHPWGSYGYFLKPHNVTFKKYINLQSHHYLLEILF